MTIYAAMIMLTELLLLTMTIHVASYPGFTRVQKRWYLFTFIAIMICAGAEFLRRYFDLRGPGFVFPLSTVTVLEFCLSPMLPVFFAGSMGMYRPAIVAGTVFCLNALVEIISAPFGWVFYFDAAGKYFRGPYYLIYEGSYTVSIIFMVVCLFYVGKRFRRRDAKTIVMVLVIMVTALASMSFFKAYTDYLGIAICACLSYIYYNDLVQADIQTELVSKQNRISDMQTHMISGLANLIESRDVETGEHVARTSRYVRILASSARMDGVYADRLDDHAIDLMYQAAPLHDIGKIVVSDQILRKPGKLTDEEFEQMKRHAAEGGSVVREVLGSVADDEYLAFAADIATYHHEWWDGGGYPCGLAGEDIPLPARIMAIADVFDALVSERCYKKAMPPEKAFEIIREEAGTHFDPQLVRVFLDHREEFVNGTELEAQDGNCTEGSYAAGGLQAETHLPKRQYRPGEYGAAC